jgi:hypothetical protein
MEQTVVFILQRIPPTSLLMSGWVTVLLPDWLHACPSSSSNCCLGVPIRF